MDCQQIRLMLSAFQDGHVVESERRVVAAHLVRCGACSLQLGQLEMARQTLRAIPTRPAPIHLNYSLRAMASREAAHRRGYAGFRGWVRGFSERIILFANNLMRPLAVPAAGGLASAVFLFSMMMTNFQGIVRQPHNDVPISVATEPTVRSILVDLSDDAELTLDVFVDEQGRVIDYSFPDGYGTLKSSQMRRKLENTLLLTDFNPATSFGQPVSGWVKVKFVSVSEIDVKG